MGKKLLIVGEDKRQFFAAKHLQNSGFEVVKDDFSDADVLILGLFSDEEKIFVDTGMDINKLLTTLKKGAIVIGGKISDELKNRFFEKDIRCFEYLGREEFAVMNAVPTAEGAIEIAMHELPVTLYGSKCLVVGFGRIGKVLAARLKSLGADVSVSARKCGDLAWVSVFGYTPANTGELKPIIYDYPIVFNTVPYMIFDKTLLRNMKRDALIIDLASKPGGVDFDEAKKIGINAVSALSLPGKVAPDSAGKIIADTVINIINET